MADFSRYFDRYLALKHLRGMNPSVNQGQATFAPYFNRQADLNIRGQQMSIAERQMGLKERAQTAEEQQKAEALTWDRENTLAKLAQEKWYQDELMSQAKRFDNMQLGANVLTGVGSALKYPLYKKFGYL